MHSEKNQIEDNLGPVEPEVRSSEGLTTKAPLNGRMLFSYIMSQLTDDML